MPLECFLYKFTKSYMQLSFQMKFDKTFKPAHPRTSGKPRADKSYSRGPSLVDVWAAPWPTGSTRPTWCLNCVLLDPSTMQRKHLPHIWHVEWRRDGRGTRREGPQRKAGGGWGRGEGREPHDFGRVALHHKCRELETLREKIRWLLCKKGWLVSGRENTGSIWPFPASDTLI